MANGGAILVADDEHSFLRSTVELLRAEGYRCDGVASADEAIETLQRERYDLLIADIKMPGNPNFRIVHGVQQLAAGTPVILVTGYPSIDTAVAAVGLPVLAYLIKPIDYDVLLKHIETAMEKRPQFCVIAQVVEALRKCVEELEAVGAARSQPIETSGDGESPVSSVTIRRLATCLVELVRIYDLRTARDEPRRLCQVVDCPQWSSHQAVVRDAIEVLRDTKSRFKSKELADLRHRLVRYLGIHGN